MGFGAPGPGRSLPPDVAARLVESFRQRFGSESGAPASSAFKAGQFGMGSRITLDAASTQTLNRWSRLWEEQQVVLVYEFRATSVGGKPKLVGDFVACLKNGNRTTVKSASVPGDKYELAPEVVTRWMHYSRQRRDSLNLAMSYE